MKAYKLILTLACAAFVLAGASADAATKTFDRVTSGNWRVDANWSGGDGTYPKSGDRAVIPTGKTCTITGTDEACDSISVVGTLNIAAGRVLTLSNADAADSSVDGTINLQGSASELAFITNGHIVAGAGSIDGQHDLAKITVAENRTLTSRLNTASEGITGALRIEGDGSFTNEGRLDADYNSGGNETLLIDVRKDMADDTNVDRYLVSANGAKLQFASTLCQNGTLSTLDGNFVLTSGDSSSEMIFDHALTTNGRFEVSVGVVRVNQDVTAGNGTSTFFDLRGTGQFIVQAGDTFLHY